MSEKPFQNAAIVNQMPFREDRFAAFRRGDACIGPKPTGGTIPKERERPAMEPTGRCGAIYSLAFSFCQSFYKKNTENATVFVPVAFFCMAERVGFEPTARCRVTGFQDQLHKPLGHLSINILPVLLKKVKQANGGVRGI